MENIYHMTPLRGCYMETFSFHAVDLDVRDSYKYDPQGYSDFTTRMTMSEGAVVMDNSEYGFEVGLQEADGVSRSMLLLVDNPFNPSHMAFMALDEDDDENALPTGALQRLRPCSFITGYATQYFFDHCEHWTKEEFSEAEIIRELDGALQSDETPWRGELFLKMNREVPMVDPSGIMDSLLLARRWVLRNSAEDELFITALGVKDEPDFQESLVKKYGFKPLPLSSDAERLFRVLH